MWTSENLCFETKQRFLTGPHEASGGKLSENLLFEKLEKQVLEGFREP